jgi:hypothetical protein
LAARFYFQFCLRTKDRLSHRYLVLYLFGESPMKHDMKRMFIVGSAALALAVALPSLADARVVSGHHINGQNYAAGHNGYGASYYGGTNYSGSNCGSTQTIWGSCSGSN